MIQLGDYRAGSTIDFKFPTQDSTGAPITLAGTPSVEVYKANGTTQTTTGVTLTVDFDGTTGSHHVRIVTTDSFYAAGNDYQVKLAAGTVGGVSVANRTLAHFSIENRADALRFAIGTTQTNATPTTYDILLASGASTGRNFVGCTIDIGGRFRRITAHSAASNEIQVDVATGISHTDTTYAYTIYPLIGSRIDADSQSRIEQEILEQIPEAIDLDANGRVRIAAGNGAGELDFTAGVLKANVVQVLGTAVEAEAGTVNANVVSIANNAVTANAIANNALTDAKVAAGALNGKGDWLLASSYVVPLDEAGVRTAIGLATNNLDTQLAALPEAGEIADAVFAETVDGVAFSKFVQLMLAQGFNELGVAESGGTVTLTFYARDGSTTIATLPFTKATGARAAGATIL